MPLGTLCRDLSVFSRVGVFRLYNVSVLSRYLHLENVRTPVARHLGILRYSSQGTRTQYHTFHVHLRLDSACHKYISFSNRRSLMGAERITHTHTDLTLYGNGPCKRTMKKPDSLAAKPPGKEGRGGGSRTHMRSVNKTHMSRPRPPFYVRGGVMYLFKNHAAHHYYARIVQGPVPSRLSSRSPVHSPSFKRSHREREREREIAVLRLDSRSTLPQNINLLKSN